MAEPFLGEIRMMSFNFAPRGWATCSGQLFPINQNQALYALLGTTYGGNGQTTFALPDLRGRVPLHFGGGFTQGQAVGEPSHTLSPPEMAEHTHVAVADDTVAPAGGNLPSGTKRLAGSQPLDLWGQAQQLQPMNPGSISD